MTICLLFFISMIIKTIQQKIWKQQIQDRILLQTIIKQNKILKEQFVFKRAYNAIKDAISKIEVKKCLIYLK